MISYAEARSLLEADGRRVSVRVETIPLTLAPGRICARETRAPIAIQPFDNSAMDGYAVRLSDLRSLPATLDVRETIAAGDAPQHESAAAGACAAVMTGAMIPGWAQAVVPVELAARQDNKVTFTQMPDAGDHIRRKGHDFREGDIVAREGEVLKPGHVMALATLGYPDVEVRERIKACFLATGRELSPSGESLPPAKIYNSNLPYALSVFPDMGIDCAAFHVIPDDAAAFKKAVTGALDQGCRLVISSGAVSAGSFDFVRKALEDMGAEIVFHKAAIKPGKPVLFARLAKDAHYFGLPGNPAATAAGLRFFVQPFLDACRGLLPEAPLKAVLEEDFVKKNDLRLFLKAQARLDDAARLSVRLLDGQESFMTSPFLRMNAWAVIPEQSHRLDAGSLVDIYPTCRHGKVF